MSREDEGGHYYAKHSGTARLRGKGVSRKKEAGKWSVQCLRFSVRLLGSGPCHPPVRDLLLLSGEASGRGGGRKRNANVSHSALTVKGRGDRIEGLMSVNICLFTKVP